MKTKGLLLLLAGGLLVLAIWYLQPNDINPDVPNPLLPTIPPGEGDASGYDVPEKYRDTVRKGLEYLLKNQHKDGHWEGDDGKHPVAMTGLAGLALLMDRDWSTDREGKYATTKYATNIRRAVDWLMDKSMTGRDGLIFSEHISETDRYMEGHGLATLFLAGACKDEQDVAQRKKLTDVLMRSVKYIVKAQSSQGGWYHTSKMEGHDFDAISTTVIQIQALQAAENAGIPVPGETLSDAQEYLNMTMGKYDRDNTVKSRGRLSDTAAVLASRPGTAPWGRPNIKDELGEKWIKYCQTEIPVGRDLKLGRDASIHYYYAQAMFNVGGDTWSVYRTAMFDRLQSSQNKDGSWPASDGISVGPVYATALWCTILQLDKNSHPSTRQIGIRST